MSYPLAVACLAFGGIGALLYRRYLFKRRVMSLDWPRGLSLMQVNRCAQYYLLRNGWKPDDPSWHLKIQFACSKGKARIRLIVPDTSGISMQVQIQDADVAAQTLREPVVFLLYGIEQTDLRGVHMTPRVILMRPSDLRTADEFLPCYVEQNQKWFRPELVPPEKTEVKMPSEHAPPLTAGTPIVTPPCSSEICVPPTGPDITIFDLKESTLTSGSLGSGWSGKESWGRWTVGERTEFSIQCPDGDGKSFELGLSVGTIFTKLRPDQSAEFFVAGRPVGQIEIKSFDLQTMTLIFDLPGQIAAGLPLEICIVPKYTTSPKDAGLSADSRALGIRCGAIWVRRIN